VAVVADATRRAELTWTTEASESRRGLLEPLVGEGGHVQQLPFDYLTLLYGSIASGPVALACCTTGSSSSLKRHRLTTSFVMEHWRRAG
jgi:hypothetical protein